MPESQSSPAPKPIDHSYWVVEGRFLAGEYPRHLDGPDEFAKLESLEAAGVSLYVDLTEEGELYPYSDRLESAEHRPSMSASSSQSSADYRHTRRHRPPPQERQQGHCVPALLGRGWQNRNNRRMLAGTARVSWREGPGPPSGTLEPMPQVGMEGISIYERATRLHP